MSCGKSSKISNDDFIRTTEERQKRAVQYLWERMEESGYIYKGSYDGWYCVPDETFFTETQVEKADEARGTEGAHLCPDCDRPLERVKEESWFFKLSAFQDKLLALYDEHPDFVQPDFRMNEVRSFVEGGLNDLSVSRTSFDWGIQVPFDDEHVTYVWFDALTNYMTAVGYGQEGDEAAADFAYRWPAQTHIVGKDIIRFHCVIWPAMLMALGEALPEHVFAHGFLTVKNEETGKAEKMSKSRGNAIAPREVIEKLGVEGYRYYFMTDVTPGTDGAISFGRMEQVYNADLANSWGNLDPRAPPTCASSTSRAPRPSATPTRLVTPRTRWPPWRTASSSATPPRWRPSPTVTPSRRSWSSSMPRTSTSRTPSRGHSPRTPRRPVSSPT